MKETGSTRLRVLWRDAMDALTEGCRDVLASEGIDVVPLPAGEPDVLAGGLAAMNPDMGAIVVRLSESLQPLRELQSQCEAMQWTLPIVARVDGDRLALGLAALKQGAVAVLPSEEWSGRVWREIREQINDRKAHRSSTAAEYVFVDPSSRHLLELACRVARAEVSTLLTGPTGAGKEVLARIIHEMSPRANGPFVAVNCAALPETMIEDMLFGHEKGAFTGALRDHPGVFEQAHGGSLFLDEIGEMPVGLQARLLRVLQERQVLRLGGRQIVNVNVRLIAATNRDLRKAIDAGDFREDLYFRLSTFRMGVPPLRNRRLDIIPLAQHMLDQHELSGSGWELSEDARLLLLEYAWPGNVRELCNVIQRAKVLSAGPRIGAEHLVFDEPYAETLQFGAMTGEAGEPAASPAALDDAVRNSEQRMITAALRSTKTREEAARLLGISPRTLRYKLARLRTLAPSQSFA